jgi:multidrug efflux pump subunit AcrA (membrane-fusion protein)
LRTTFRAFAGQLIRALKVSNPADGAVRNSGPIPDEVSIMQFLRTRRFIIAALLVVIGVPATYLLARDRGTAESSLIAPVKRGDFRVTVTTSGELRAPKFVQVTLPQNAMQAQVFQLKIASLVPEGSLVKEGDIVAEVDRSPLATKQTEVSLTLQKAEAQHEQAMLDSTLNLGKAREEMKTMELSVEEKRIAKEQAIYGRRASSVRPRSTTRRPSARWHRPRSTTRRRPSRPRPRCARLAPTAIGSGTSSRTSWTS